MNTEEYMKNTAKTESLDLEGAAVRLRNEKLIQTLCYKLRRFQEASDDLDEIKKHIFYGTDINLFVNDNSLKAFVDLKEVKNMRLLHHSLGLATEAGELNEQVWNYIFFTGELDTVNMVEELGDTFWYASRMIDTLRDFNCKVSFGSIFKKNIAKLKKRFKSLFSTEQAIKRNLTTERKALEDE